MPVDYAVVPRDRLVRMRATPPLTLAEVTEVIDRNLAARGSTARWWT